MKLLQFFEAIQPQQLVNVDTPAFRSWFGSSKAVDDQGHPIVFFRGTAKRPSAAGFATKRSLPSFVASADIASIYAASYKKSMLGTPFGQEPAAPTFQSGATVSPVFLSIQNPVDMRGREAMNMEMDIFGLLMSDWSNETEMQLMLDILGELERAEDRGVQFEYELPDLPGTVSVADWNEVIDWIQDTWEEVNEGGWSGNAAEIFTSVLAGIYVDSYAVVDAPTFTEWAAAKGFDGVVHDDVFEQGAKYSQTLLGKDVPGGLDDEDMHTTWRPFDAAQVKSIFNQGGWSAEPGSGMHEAWKIHRKNNTFIVVDGEMGSGWEEITESIADFAEYGIMSNPDRDYMNQLALEVQKTAHRDPHIKGFYDPRGRFWVWDGRDDTVHHNMVEFELFNEYDQPDFGDWFDVVGEEALAHGYTEEQLQDYFDNEGGYIPFIIKVDDGKLGKVWTAYQSTLQEPEVRRALGESVRQRIRPMRRNVMERFAKADVNKLFSFWAHPQTGQIYHNKVTHTMAATDPDGPIALTQFGQLGPDAFDDIDVFKAAFKLGWVRGMYLEDDVAAGKQIALHGANQGIVRETLRLMLEKGLDIESMGLRGEFDGYEYDGIPEDLEPV